MRTLARWEKKGKWEALRSVRAAPTAVWSCARDGPDERMVCDDRPIERRERKGMYERVSSWLNSFNSR